MLHVVHEIQSQRLRSAGIQRREDTGLTFGRHLPDLIEARLAQHSHRQFAAFIHAAILCPPRQEASPKADEPGYIEGACEHDSPKAIPGGQMIRHIPATRFL